MSSWSTRPFQKYCYDTLPNLPDPHILPPLVLFARELTEIPFFQALCGGYPTEFASYFHYCRSLRFDDRPDYSYLKKTFRDLFIREGFNLYPTCYLKRVVEMVFKCSFDWFTFYCIRIPVWLCLWLDYFKVSTITACKSTISCSCKFYFFVWRNWQQSFVLEVLNGPVGLQFGCPIINFV